MVGMGWIVRPPAKASRKSIKNTDMPLWRFATSSRGEVLANNNIRSECSAREVHIFWPLIIYSLPSLLALVRMRVVSLPLVGSVTPKACNRNSPEAIFGKYSDFCLVLP